MRYRPPTHLRLDQACALLKLDELGVLDLVANGVLRLVADGFPLSDLRTFLGARRRATDGTTAAPSPD